MSALSVEILKGAREILAVPGVWVNHCPRGEGEQCAQTALGEVAFNLRVAHRDVTEAMNALRRALPDERGGDPVDPVNRVTAWNDQPGRTLDEVLSAFDRAIAILEVKP